MGSEQRTPRRIRSGVACRQKEFGFGTHGIHRIRGSTRRVPTCQTTAGDAQVFRFLCTACASGPTFPITSCGCPRRKDARWLSLCCNKRNSLDWNSGIDISLPICASQTGTMHSSHCTLTGALATPSHACARSANPPRRILLHPRSTANRFFHPHSCSTSLPRPRCLFCMQWRCLVGRLA